MLYRAKDMVELIVDGGILSWIIHMGCKCHHKCLYRGQAEEDLREKRRRPSDQEVKIGTMQTRNSLVSRNWQQLAMEPLEAKSFC